MNNFISNPIKTFTINQNIDKIRDCLAKLDKVYTDIKTISYNKVLDQFEYDIDEGPLSFGVKALINLNNLDDRTLIEIELQRNIGGFNTWDEIDFANKHLNSISKGLSILLDGDDYQLPTNKVSWTHIFISVIIFIFIFIFITLI